MVFQDPYGALNPLHTVEYTVMRPVPELPRHVRTRRPRSGSPNCSRRWAWSRPASTRPSSRTSCPAASASACSSRARSAATPHLIVADEPVSMLDVSLRAGVLKLLAELRRTRGLSLLYITHDLLSARLITDEILVLSPAGSSSAARPSRSCSTPRTPTPGSCLTRCPARSRPPAPWLRRRPDPPAPPLPGRRPRMTKPRTIKDRTSKPRTIKQRTSNRFSRRTLLATPLITAAVVAVTASGAASAALAASASPGASTTTASTLTASTATASTATASTAKSERGWPGQQRRERARRRTVGGRPAAVAPLCRRDVEVLRR